MWRKEKQGSCLARAAKDEGHALIGGAESIGIVVPNHKGSGRNLRDILAHGGCRGTVGQECFGLLSRGSYLLRQGKRGGRCYGPVEQELCSPIGFEDDFLLLRQISGLMVAGEDARSMRERPAASQQGRSGWVGSGRLLLAGREAGCGKAGHNEQQEA